MKIHDEIVLLAEKAKDEGDLPLAAILYSVAAASAAGLTEMLSIEILPITIRMRDILIERKQMLNN